MSRWVGEANIAGLGNGEEGDHGEENENELVGHFSEFGLFFEIDEIEELNARVDDVENEISSVFYSPQH